MGMQMAFYVNQQVCMGCKTCQVSCKDKNDLKVGQLWRRVYEVEGGGYSVVGDAVYSDVQAYYLSISCNHCQDAPCVKNCPTGAMTKRAEDGIVFVDQSLCIGCRYCSWACPYGAPQFNPDSGKMRKCDFCLDLQQKGQSPACVEACPVRALEYGPLDELQKKHPDATAALKGLPDPSLTKPSVLYSPHRHAFTAGPVPSLTGDGERR